jgi:hypothetical protein
MTPELLARIVRKAQSECHVTGISLFNWTEPLLHPGLPGLIRIVEDAGIPCHLSSNLNLLPDADAIMAANPASFKISVSGFTQQTYGEYHRGGDIEQVKKNMVALVEAKKRSNAGTRIFVNYHRYRHNLHEEPLMRSFAEDLGVAFEPVWALMFPLEKILAFAEGAPADSSLTAEDRQLIDRLAFRLQDTLASAQHYQNQPCPLRDSHLSLDFQGQVILCCGVFNTGKYGVGNYLAMPLDEIQTIRQNHGMCRRCRRQGAHAFLTYAVPEMEALILEHVPAADIERMHLREEFARKSRQRRLRGLSREFISGLITGDQQAAIGGQIKRMLRSFGRVKRALLRKD